MPRSFDACYRQQSNLLAMIVGCLLLLGVDVRIWNAKLQFFWIL